MASQDSHKVIVKKTKLYGKGVFAIKKIHKDEIIAIFDGPIYDGLFDAWTDDLLCHAIQCGETLWRDSTGLARYINHSCEPNCGVKNFFSITAMRTIQPGEQITWDYEMTEKSNWFKMRCRCGSPLCRKIIGNYKNMPRKIRKKYKGYISDWLLGKKLLLSR